MSRDRPDKATARGRVRPPVNVQDGIPDRSARPVAWKYVVLAAIFLGWVAFLIYCALAGNL
jgi:hypothetical protein